MKTISQIYSKAEKLRVKLSKKDRFFKTFGGKEYKKLEKFVGDINKYPPAERAEIQAVLNQFTNSLLDKFGASIRWGAVQSSVWKHLVTDSVWQQAAKGSVCNSPGSSIEESF